MKLRRALGWIPDLPDHRDYTQDSPEVSDLTSQMFKHTFSIDSVSKVDLRQYFSPVEDQENIGSCTAHAAMGIVEYYQRRKKGKFVDGSRLFLYKVTRNMMHVTGDTGAWLRTVMGALKIFGVPPEREWPYDTKNFDVEPPAYVYGWAQNYQAMKYFRVDRAGWTPDQTHKAILNYLSKGNPLMFGFTVFNSLWNMKTDNVIPFPGSGDKVEGGHAVIIAGYDTEKPTNVGKGAYLIRNSWGTGWGEQGYGWLPFEYVLKGLADDFWGMTQQEWVDIEPFAE